MSRDRNIEGFTIIELAVVTATIGILVLIGVASYGMAITRAQAAVCASECRVMTRAVEVSAATTGRYPDDISDLHGSVSNWDSSSRCPCGHALVYDDATHRIICPVHSR